MYMLLIPKDYIGEPLDTTTTARGALWCTILMINFVQRYGKYTLSGQGALGLRWKRFPNAIPILTFVSYGALRGTLESARCLGCRRQYAVWYGTMRVRGQVTDCPQIESHTRPNKYLHVTSPAQCAQIFRLAAPTARAAAGMVLRPSRILLISDISDFRKSGPSLGGVVEAARRERTIVERVSCSASMHPLA